MPSIYFCAKLLSCHCEEGDSPTKQSPNCSCKFSKNVLLSQDASRLRSALQWHYDLRRYFMLSPIEKVLFVLAVAASLYFTYQGVKRIIGHISSGQGKPNWGLIWKRIGD